MPDTLVIRADANRRMGTGHIMRCLALAQCRQQEEGSAVLFITAASLPALDDRLCSEGMQVKHLGPVRPGGREDARMTAEIAGQHAARWLVVDGYHFDADYQKALKDAGYCLLLLDGFGFAEHYFADLVLNQNICARADMYDQKEPYTRLLLGTSHALLRREFWSWRGWRRDVPQNAGKLLVTLGGSDPDNVTQKVIQALQHIDDRDFEAIVVVGGGNEHFGSLEAAVDGTDKISLRRNVSDMPRLMAWADLAISAGGSTCWELAFMGVPSLLLVLADNQKCTAQRLHEEGAAVCLGDAKEVSAAAIATAIATLQHNASRRSALSSKAAELVDGNGAQRVLAALAPVAQLEAS